MLQQQIQKLKKSERNLKAQNKRLLDKVKELDTLSLSAAIEAVAKCLKQCNGKAIANAAFVTCGGVAEDELVKQSKQILRETVYSPFHIARLMDLTGGVLNLSCIDLLQKLETKGKKYYRGSLIPSTSAIKKIFALVEKLGDVRVPYSMLQFGSGEGIRFDFEKMIIELARGFKLTKAAVMRAVGFAKSSDGSNLTKWIHHTAGGVKITDPAAINPLTDELMFATSPGMDKTVVSTQS